jgi:hypothetical protein
MANIVSIRVPVCNAEGLIVERADASRVRILEAASNATVVRKGIRKGGGIVRIVLGSAGDDSLRDARQGNPLTYSHNKDTEDNPVNVWTLKRLPSSTADIFRAVLNDVAA